MPSLSMDQPAARIRVDHSWLGAPDSALLGNPTVWLFVVVAVTLTLTTVFHLRGALGVVPTVALNAVAVLFLALTFDFLPHYPYDSRERFLDTRIGWTVEPLETS